MDFWFKITTNYWCYFGVIILYKSYIYNDILLSIISILFIVWDSYLVLFENDTKKYFL